MKNVKYHILIIIVFITAADLHANECYVHKLTIARHIDTNITTELIDKKLLDASSLLYNTTTENDFSCCVRLVREGNVATFGNIDDKLNEIDNPSDLRKVWHLSKHNIKVVKILKLPAHLGIFGKTEPKDGQAYPGLTMVITQDASPAVWAHEFGHFKHIWSHRDESSSNIMNTYASTIGELSESDCKLIQIGGVSDGARPKPPTVDEVNPKTPITLP